MALDIIEVGILSLCFAGGVRAFFHPVSLLTSPLSWQRKLKNHKYPTMTTVESDLRRMISNAKSFNEKSSQLFSDAEKIRKAVSNFMLENNPAYQTDGYKPFPTPVPLDEEKEDEEMTPEGLGESFEGDTFQRAQEKIVAEMLDLRNDE